MATYFPSTDSGMLNWAQGFSGFINAGPEAYGLTIEDAAAYTAAVTAYADALTVATNSGTRTTPTIQDKNTKKKDLIAATRPLVNTIQAFSGTTDMMRADLQITIRDTEPTPVPVPVTSPTLNVVSVFGRTIKFHLRDGDTESRARPEGVKGAVIHYAVGDTFPQDLSGWVFKGNTTKTTVDVTIPSNVPAGSKIWLLAQWTNTKLQTGPACTPVWTSIADGMTQAA